MASEIRFPNEHTLRQTAASLPRLGKPARARRSSRLKVKNDPGTHCHRTYAHREQVVYPVAMRTWVRDQTHCTTRRGQVLILSHPCHEPRVGYIHPWPKREGRASLQTTRSQYTLDRDTRYKRGPNLIESSRSCRHHS